MEEEDQSLFGRMSRELCDRDRAEAVFQPSVRDREAPIRVDKPIRVRRGWPSELRLRIRRPGDDEPATLFAEDGRQRIVCADAKAVELHLRHRPPLIPVEVQQALLGWVPTAEAEFLESNFFIRCDDPLVQQQAQAALGAEGEKLSPLEKARRIRRWIRRNIRPNYEIAFATADEVARCRQGDCTEMGILAAAMARAVGVPSRVVFGLVYDADNHGFGGHLWTEVFADGQWHPLDATGVIDTVGAAYIKIAAYSLKDVLNPDALVAIRRAFTGPLDVEVLEAR
jgi:transglutaminase-like putative cysteine protease